MGVVQVLTLMCAGTADPDPHRLDNQRAEADFWIVRAYWQSCLISGFYVVEGERKTNDGDAGNNLWHQFCTVSAHLHFPHCVGPVSKSVCSWFSQGVLSVQSLTLIPAEQSNQLCQGELMYESLTPSRDA